MGLLVRRGTRAALDALAAANSLAVGELYFITDEARLAVGTSVNTYSDGALLSEAGGGGASPIPVTVAAGDDTAYSWLAGATGTTSTSYQELIGNVRSLVAGTIRITAQHRTTNSTFVGNLRVLLNGSVVTTWTTTGASYIARTLDLAVARNDLIQVQHRAGNSNFQVLAQNLFFKIDDADAANKLIALSV